MNNISKILHLYWDDSPMSFLQTLTVDSFHKYNPDWKIIVYVPKNINASNVKYVPDYLGDDYFHLVRNKEYVEIKTVDLADFNIDLNLHSILRSDIFRYKILYEYGGVWSDFDVIWLKPMTHLYSVDYVGDVKIDNMKGTVCMFNTTTGHHNISVLIHAKECIFLKAIIDETSKIQKENKIGHQDYGTDMLNNMFPTFESIKTVYNKIIALKYETIFPYSINNMNALYKKNDLSYLNNNVLCVHWFNGHELSKEYVNRNNYFKRIDCSITTILKNEKWI